MHVVVYPSLTSNELQKINTAEETFFSQVTRNMQLEIRTKRKMEKLSFYQLEIYELKSLTKEDTEDTKPLTKIKESYGVVPFSVFLAKFPI